jgi:mono/diheme cytochrome c family protein
MHRVLMLGAMILVLWALSLNAASPPDYGQVVRESCSSCHSLGRVCSNVGQGRAYWSDTVGRMVRNGARVNPGEVDAVAVFLAELPPGDKGVCR